MPVEEGRFIPHEVIEGILKQDYPVRLWVSTKCFDRDCAAARNHIKRYGAFRLEIRGWTQNSCALMNLEFA
jgi:hypothetical protein